MPVPRAKEARLKVGGKLNLYLAVIGRAGNYHLLETVYQSIDLYDELRIRLEGRGVRLECVGMEASGENLAYKAGENFRSRFGIREGIHIELKKRVPIGRGLGGGSADAAGVLLALAQLYGVPREELIPLASSLGADVPFFLYGGCAIGRGRGDIVEPLDFLPSLRFLLIIPPFSLSTALVYSHLRPPYGESTIAQFIEILKKGDIMEIGEAMRNDLEKPAFTLYPQLEEVKRKMLVKGVPTLMTGSGSALFSLFKEEPPSFEKEGWEVMVVNPTSKAVEMEVIG